jgi:flagellar basal-body rod modification protein FlgD
MSYMSTITGTPDTTSPFATTKSGYGSLDQTDFLRLLTEQMKQQDPMNPMDNTEMVAQMAQFSTLSTSADMSSTLKDIATKLDAVLAAQQATTAAITTTPTA